MTNTTSAPRAGASGSARPDGRIEPDPIPEDLLADRAPGEFWAPSGVPPSGQWALMRPTETRIGWLIVCPACCKGWCRLLPDSADPFDYALDLAQGCSRGCETDEVAWWHLWRLGELPPREPVQADERARRYAAGAVRRILSDLPDCPSLPELRRAAYAAGRWLAAADLPPASLACALLAAAARAGLDPATIARELAAAVTAGSARPGRIPR